MQIGEIEKILFEGKKLVITAEDRNRIERSFNFLKQFSADKIIYGINTGFGPMAQYRIPDYELLSLQYNIIRSHSAGAGEPFEEIYVKAAMLSRYMTFASGKSGVHISALEMLAAFINNGVYPRTVHSDACADGINVRIVGPDSHLCTASGLTCYRLDIDASVPDLGNLGLEQALYKERMRT